MTSASPFKSQQRGGRPSKPALSEAEVALVRLWRRSGWGWDSCASEISKPRTEKYGTPEAKARRAVSGQWLRKQFSNETQTPTKYHNERSMANLQRKPKLTGDKGTRITFCLHGVAVGGRCLECQPPIHGENAGVQQSKADATVGNEVVAKGGA